MSCILLIDDDETFRLMLRGVLTLHGHTVVEAHNGLDALAKLGHASFDAAIVDIVMPERDGFETIIALRQRHPALRIVAISGGGQLSGKSYLAVAARLGADAVLAKPFAVEGVLAALEGREPKAC